MRVGEVHDLDTSDERDSVVDERKIDRGMAMNLDGQPVDQRADGVEFPFEILHLSSELRRSSPCRWPRRCRQPSHVRGAYRQGAVGTLSDMRVSCLLMLREWRGIHLVE